MLSLLAVGIQAKCAKNLEDRGTASLFLRVKLGMTNKGAVARFATALFFVR